MFLMVYMNGILEDTTVQWIVFGIGIFIFLVIIRAFFLRKQMKKAMSPAAQGDVRNIEAEERRKKKILDQIKKTKSKQGQQAGAKELEGETQKELAQEKKLENDLKRNA